MKKPPSMKLAWLKLCKMKAKRGQVGEAGLGQSFFVPSRKIWKLENRFITVCKLNYPHYVRVCWDVDGCAVFKGDYDTLLAEFKYEEPI